MDKSKSHPMQPIVVVGGVHRFMENRIIRRLLEYVPNGLNEIATWDADPDDYAQLMMLIGYSVSGCPRLSPAMRTMADEHSIAILNGAPPPSVEDLCRQVRADTLAELRQAVDEMMEGED